MMGRPRVARVLLAAVWILFVVAVYCGDLGRGFVKDDFTWIRTARIALAQPSTLLLQRDVGFYRPIVTLSFAGDYWLHGTDSRGYGWTNLTLFGMCALALAGLAYSLGLSIDTAILAVVLWGINPHGLNVALIWLSGRTALCLTLFSLLTAIAFLHRRWTLTAIALTLALASKEEAVALPFILLAWQWTESRERRVPWSVAFAVLAPLAMYLVFRSLTPALTPATAPPFYRFTIDPWAVARNIVEYADRSATAVTVAIVVAAALFRARPQLTARHRQLLAMMVIWAAGMFAITVWLPVRSSLYAVCPSIAVAIAGALTIEQLREAAAPARSRLELVIALLLLTLVPIYHGRDGKYVEAARVSARTIRQIQQDLPRLQPAGSLLFVDDPVDQSFRGAFGDLASEAMQVTFNAGWQARIENPPASEPATYGPLVARYQITRGTVSRVER